MVEPDIDALLHEIFGTNPRNPHKKLCRSILDVLSASNPGIVFSSGEATVDEEPARWIHWERNMVRFSIYLSEHHLNLTRRRFQWNEVRQKIEEKPADQTKFDAGSRTLLRDLLRAVRDLGFCVTVRGLSMLDHGMRLSE